MDEFVGTAKRQVIRLHPLDTQASFLNIPYHFFFANSDNAPDFMPSDAMRVAFYRALRQFPILAGCLRPEGKGQTSIVVDPLDLNMPEYVESQSDVHFDTLRDAKFHHSAWPAGLTRAGAITMATTGDLDKKERIRMANVHVVRLRDNSGVAVFLNIPHYVVDGTGFFSFAELWGRHCAAERSGNSELVRQAAQAEFCFDRDVIARHLPSVDRKPLSQDTLQVYTGFSPIADWLAWLSPGTRGRLLSRAKFSANVVSHTFRVPLSALAQLRKQIHALSASNSATGDAAEDVGDLEAKYSDRYLMAAILSKLVARAHRSRKELEATSSKKWSLLGTACSVLKTLTNLVFGNGDASRYQSLNLLDDVRHGLAIGDLNYMGNGLLPHNTQCPLDVLETPITTESLALAVDLVRPVYENADAALIASFVDMISANHRCFTRPMVYLASHPESLVVTSETEFKLYAADFGNGPPEWVCTIPSFVANFVGVLPCPPPSTDIVVNIIMKAPVMAQILRDEFWRDLTQIVY
ncbi:hypothetical protein GGI04_001052 [Coemansia thaxteri]|uniref:Uncharacterized protein n=1 Tax=Coemansia thaxteri TaxID=2663907 RepID=A0A9W8BMJ6_9FUNG|nr:hypothetical protein H4R26_001231 [Coemansia thaxteri]KAJ2008657.1 hypothetical protein GGI04_001052 [Coemansia thaxteri]KAJ2472787.1 hypothetical protein GGI02_001345 [Coemansia sp. RSA 2322]KAJ2485410.1 hypothetical protein EV174_001754 [Coemansia sp. RSA 2320]